MKWTKLIGFLCGLLILITPKIIYGSEDFTRLQGVDRYETAKAISERVNFGTVSNVILASGNNYPDALSASSLAHKLAAPILLVDSTAQSSNIAFDYIKTHLGPTGHIYLMGGIGVIGTDFIERLNGMGFSSLQITQLGGNDRYETSSLIANQLNVIEGSTAIITTGEDFRDALAISSFAANVNWPILLTAHDRLPESIKTFLLAENPSEIFLIGDNNSVNLSVESSIKLLMPNSKLIRINGNNFAHEESILFTSLAPNPKQLYIASSVVFADSLSGSALASQDNSPIILLNPNDPIPIDIANYIRSIPQVPITALGGSGAIPPTLLRQINDIWLNPIIPASNTNVPASANVRAKAISSDSILIGWDKVEGIETYHIYTSNAIDGPYSLFQNLLGTSDQPWVAEYSAKLTGIPSETTIYVKVTSIKDGKESQLSVAASARTLKATTIKGPLKLYADDQDKTYLGMLTTNTLEPDSIFNEYGLYGSKYALNSIFNKYGLFGGTYSLYSSFNKYTLTPPIIVDEDGNIIGKLTTNSNVLGAIDPNYLYQTLQNLGF